MRSFCLRGYANSYCSFGFGYDENEFLGDVKNSLHWENSLAGLF